jgi:hypothetical protein
MEKIVQKRDIFIIEAENTYNRKVKIVRKTLLPKKALAKTQETQK